MFLTAYIGAAIHDGHGLHLGKALVCDPAVALRIVDIEDLPAGCSCQTLDGGYITPGFVDLQVNGGGGVMFNDEQSVTALETIAGAHADTGTRALLATLITDTPQRTHKAIDAVEAAIERGVPGISGIHLEGPHLSVSRKGAHDPDLIRAMTDSDLDMIVGAAARLPNVMATIAPENVTLDQVTALVRAGVIVSLGHSDCDYNTAIAYMQAGASCTTHLFNAMSQLGSREPGLVGATLDSPACFAGLIADAVHVHPATIRTALRAKSGLDRIFLVTDAMSSVGSDLGSFELNGRTVFRRDGSLQLEDGTLAGADIDMTQSLRVLVQQVGLDAAQAIGMATGIPGSILKPTAFNGLIEGEMLGNILYMDDDFRVQPLG